MARNSKIEWTHHTFNPWWGCTKVSAACKHCYAETWANRVGERVWGAKAPRRFLSEQHWLEPRRWNREATELGERRRVFCASMADVFENRRELDMWRKRLWHLIEETSNLDWLLLTKRPESIAALAPWTDRWPQNVWLGTTIESQRWVEKRLKHLLSHPAAVHFVSCEPLLGSLDLRPWLAGGTSSRIIDWVITGGESGHGARPMNPSWAINLRNQCQETGTAFHFKQWGHWAPEYGVQEEKKRQKKQVKGADGQPITLVRVPKKIAGRTLQGEIWDQFPQPSL